MNGSVGRVIHLAFSLGMMRSPLEREHDLGVFKALSGAEQPVDCRGSQRQQGNQRSMQKENPADRRAWPATVHGVAKSRTRLSD